MAIFEQVNSPLNITMAVNGINKNGGLIAISRSSSSVVTHGWLVTFRKLSSSFHF